MSEQQYTPGPWMVEQTEARNWVGPMRKPNDGKVSRIVFWNERGDGLKPEHSDRHDADALLIAAAPDLLAELQAMLDLTEGDDDWDDPIKDPERYAARIRAREATRKAETGRSGVEEMAGISPRRD